MFYCLLNNIYITSKLIKLFVSQADLQRKCIQKLQVCRVKMYLAVLNKEEFNSFFCDYLSVTLNGNINDLKCKPIITKTVIIWLNWSVIKGQF